MRALTGIVIGAGERGARAYVPYLLANPDAGRIVAVAEPRRERREAFAARHRLPASACFADHDSILEQPVLADFALIATGDALHVAPAIAAMRRGYHVLLEKPMALDEADCRELVAVSEATGRILQVCHVMRYAPLYRALAELVHAGEIGRVVSIQHAENVSYWHYAHSYCRGNWRNRAASSPMILAKSCHDLDLLYWLAGAEPESLHSQARPCELVPDNKPEGAPSFCIEGCPHSTTCPYDAVATYLCATPLTNDLLQTASPWPAAALVRGLLRLRAALARAPVASVRERVRWTGWPVSAISDDRSRAGIVHALRTTPYGRCVYQVGDNDQVSSQNVQITFRNGVQASFTMHGHSHREGRTIRVDGTRGSVVGHSHLLEQRLLRIDHKSGRRRRIRMPLSFEAHGGGDVRLFRGFLAALRGDAEPLTSARESLQSHLMAFAADRAQRTGAVETFPIANA